MPKLPRHLRRSLGHLTVLTTLGLFGAQAHATNPPATLPNSYCTAVFSVGQYGNVQIYSPESQRLVRVASAQSSSPNAAAINGKNGWLYYVDQNTLQLHIYDVDQQTDIATRTFINNQGGMIIGASFDPSSSNYYVYFSNGTIGQYAVSGTSVFYVGQRELSDANGRQVFRSGTNGDIVINASGQAYIVGEGVGSGQTLMAPVNLASGLVDTSRLVYLTKGGSRISGINGLAFDPSGHQYYAGDTGGLYRIDMASGALTQVTSQNGFDLASCAGSTPPAAPTIAKSFNPATLTMNSSGDTVTRLSITLGNTNTTSVYLTSTLTDMLPTASSQTPGQMVVAANPVVGGSCPDVSSTVTATPGSNRISVDSGQRVPPGGCTIEVNVKLPVAGTYMNTIASGALHTTTGANATAASASVTATPSANGSFPAVCTNLYALVMNTSSWSNYNGSKIQRLDELTNTLTGPVINLPDGTTSATLGVAPDGSKFYSVTDDDYLRIFNTKTGTWSTGSHFNNVADRMVRMTVAPNGTGYAMDSGGNLWTFTSSGSVTPYGKLNSTSTNVPSFYANGDFFATQDGKLYLMSAETGGKVNLWFVNPAARTAEYLGDLVSAAAGVQFNGLAATPNGVYAANSSGQLAQIDPLAVKLTPVGGSTTGSTDLASCYYPSYGPKVSANKSVKKVAGSAGEVVHPGDTLEYTVTVRNSGNLPAGGVTFKDSLPAGTTYVPDSAKVNGFDTTSTAGMPTTLRGAAYPFAQPVGVCSLSTTSCSSQVLKIDTTPGTADNEAVVTFRVTVNEDVTNVRNQAVVTYNDGNTPPTPIPSNPTETPVVPNPQLTLAKTSNAVNGTWALDQNDAAYTLSVKNVGTVPTNSQITLQDQMPAGVTPVNATFSPASGWNCTTSGQLVTCTSTNVLAAGASVALTFPVNISAATPGSVTNKASVGGGGDPDPMPNPATCTPASTNPGNQCASATVTFTGTAKLVAEKTVQNITAGTPVGTSGTGKPGDVLEYCIKTSNQGTVTATNLHFSDSVPVTTAFLAGAYGGPGKDIHLTTTGTTSTDIFYTAAPDSDQGSVVSNQVKIDGGSFVLRPKQAFTVCFRATIQ